MAGNIAVSGKAIKCMAEECSLGLMVANMKENTHLTKKKDKVVFAGLMGGSMTGVGLMESRMGKALIALLQASKRMGSGRTEKE